jgi:hypothetical protein
VRRMTLVAAAAAAMLGLAAVPAAADSNAYGESGWLPVPQAPRDLPAGFCTFPVHLGIARDVVKFRVLETYPDGSVKQEEANGPLLVTVTNLVSGASTEVNASNAATIEFQPDGTEIFHTEGPTLIGFRDGFANNHRSGLFLLTGKLTVVVAAAGRTLLRDDGGEKDICADIS